MPDPKVVTETASAAKPAAAKPAAAKETKPKRQQFKNYLICKGNLYCANPFTKEVYHPGLEPKEIKYKEGDWTHCQIEAGILAVVPKPVDPEDD